MQRLQALLMEGGKGNLLAQTWRRITICNCWISSAPKRGKSGSPAARDSQAPSALPKPEGEITNLATGIKNSAGVQTNAAKTAVVLFSDGQHNEGESPLEVAHVLGVRGVPLFTVGFGSQVKPRDLAVVTVDGPESVFFQDTRAWHDHAQG